MNRTPREVAAICAIGRIVLDAADKHDRQDLIDLGNLVMHENEKKSVEQTIRTIVADYDKNGKKRTASE